MECRLPVGRQDSVGFDEGIESRIIATGKMQQPAAGIMAPVLKIHLQPCLFS
jgi:hypothetical protein